VSLATTSPPTATQEVAVAQATPVRPRGTNRILAARQDDPPSIELTTPATGVGGLVAVQTVPTATHEVSSGHETLNASPMDHGACRATKVERPWLDARMALRPGTTPV